MKIDITMNRYGHLYATDSHRVANALESADVDGLVVASPVAELRSADNALTTARRVMRTCLDPRETNRRRPS